MYSLAKSQACIDGNKRIALLLTAAFVRMNGGRLGATHAEIVGVVLEAAESDSSRRDNVVGELTKWMRVHVTESEE